MKIYSKCEVDEHMEDYLDFYSYFNPTISIDFCRDERGWIIGFRLSFDKGNSYGYDEVYGEWH